MSFSWRFPFVSFKATAQAEPIEPEKRFVMSQDGECYWEEDS